METSQKYKIKIFLIAFIAVIMLSILGNSNHPNVDSLPSLEQIAQMEDEAELNSYITEFTRDELKAIWGKPDASNANEDIWYINGSTNLVVSYHNNSDKVIVCGIIKMK